MTSFYRQTAIAANTVEPNPNGPTTWAVAYLAQNSETQARWRKDFEFFRAVQHAEVARHMFSMPIADEPAMTDSEWLNAWENPP